MAGHARAIGIVGRSVEPLVVLMFETRSFDNMLGGLYPRKSQASYRGFNQISPTNTYRSGPGGKGPSETVATWQGATGQAKLMETLYPDPGELFEDMNVQIFGGPVKPPGYGGTANMSGFAANYVTQAAKNNIEPLVRDIMQINWCTR